MAADGPVLIVTEPDDVHADAVIQALDARGVPVFRFHPEEFPATTSVSIEQRGTEWRGLIRNRHHTVHVEEVRAAWYRRPNPPGIAPGVPPELREFVDRQARETLRAVYALLEDRWLASPQALRRAEVKPVQLRQAARHGLDTPDTLLSNDPDSALRFRQVNRSADAATAVKSLDVVNAVAHRKEWYMGFTTVWEDDGAVDPASIAIAPAVFQRYVPKRLEIRAVVIGQQVFAAGVDAQADPVAQHDVRAGELGDAYRKVELPPRVSRALARLVRDLGLQFCSADLIHTPDGRYVFLDLNPNGQWLWLDLYAGLPLTQTLADLLAGGLPAPAPARRPRSQARPGA